MMLGVASARWNIHKLTEATSDECCGCKSISRSHSGAFLSDKVPSTVEPRYLELAYFELPLISK